MRELDEITMKIPAITLAPRVPLSLLIILAFELCLKRWKGGKEEPNAKQPGFQSVAEAEGRGHRCEHLYLSSALSPAGTTARSPSSPWAVYLGAQLNSFLIASLENFK